MPSATLFELLACPFCRHHVLRTGKQLMCAGCGRTFAVAEGVPVLVARQLPPEHAPGFVGRSIAAVVAVPRVYDLVQRLAGARKVQERLRPALANVENTLVLDVGAGTGTLESILPPKTQYLWLDSDRVKLAGFRKHSSSPAVLGDATQLPLRDGAVDWSVSVGMSHHLDDRQLQQMLDELKRVSRAGLIFLDALATAAPANRLLWRYDRGRHPRPAQTLRGELSRRFEIATASEFQVLHRYLLVTAVTG